MLRVWPIICQYGLGALLGAIGLWCGIRSGYLDLKNPEDRRLLAVLVGGFVLMHDDTVDRTTNGTGKVSDLTVAELKKLDAGSWKGRAFAGEPVPTLLEVLEAMKGKGCKAMIEVKPDGITTDRPDVMIGWRAGSAGK